MQQAAVLGDAMARPQQPITRPWGRLRPLKRPMKCRVAWQQAKPACQRAIAHHIARSRPTGAAGPVSRRRGAMASGEGAGPPEDWQQLEAATAQLEGLQLAREHAGEQHGEPREAPSG